MSGLPRALFVCIGNAGRSQMAQAFYELRGGEARSAGSRPEREVHPRSWKRCARSVSGEPMDEVRKLRGGIERRVAGL